MEINTDNVEITLLALTMRIIEKGHVQLSDRRPDTHEELNNNFLKLFDETYKSLALTVNAGGHLMRFGDEE